MLKWLGVSAAVVALDLYSKHLIETSFSYAEHLVVTPYFDLVLFRNPGAAFSFLAGAGGWQRLFFSAFAITACAVIVHLLRRHPTKPVFCLALGLILGGALGNLYDRLTMGEVVDFLFFHYRDFYWPAFNVADAAIFCGVVLLLWDEMKKSSRPE